MSTLVEVMDAIADQLEDGLTAVDGLQVNGRLVMNPTPPSIDVYPADPSQEQTAFRSSSRQAWFTIRARVSTADSDAGQELLLELMDPAGTSSVTAVLAGDRSLGGTVQSSLVEGPSGFIVYTDAAGEAGRNLLGCEWRARVIL